MFVLITFHNRQRNDYVVRGMFATHEAAQKARDELWATIANVTDVSIEIAKILGVHKL